MKFMITCPLCNSNKNKVLQSVAIAEICSIYEEDLGFNVNDQFNNTEQLEYLKCKECDLHFFYPSVNGTESFYQNLQKAHRTYYKIRPEFEFAAKYIKKNDDVLEIGAGDASFLDVLNIKNYIGLEFNDQAINRASEKGVKLFKSSVESFAENPENHYKFDVVCAFHVLEHVEKPKEFIKACKLLLRPEGILILAVPCRTLFLRII